MDKMSLKLTFMNRKYAVLQSIFKASALFRV